MKNTEPHAQETWQKLCRQASCVPAAETELPFGFSTRVAAQISQLADKGSVWLTTEQFAWRGAAVAGLIALAVLVFDYKLLTDIWSGDTPLAGSMVELMSIP